MTTAFIPVMSHLDRLFIKTPARQFLIVTGPDGLRATARNLSRAVTRYRAKAGLSSDLRLQDARGTAATRLRSLAVPVPERANIMGWSPRHAESVLLHHAVATSNSAEATRRIPEAADRGKH